MKEIFKIFSFFIPSGKKKESIHYNNIKNGKKLTINGKEYVKVKLRFVDSLSNDSAKMFDNLETENELLNDKVEKLTERLTTIEKQLALTELLNMNLLNGDKTETKKIRTEVRKLRKLQKESKNTIADLEVKVETQEKHIIELENKNQRLKKKLDEKQYEIEKLVHKMHNLTTSSNTENGGKLKKHLENKINVLTKEVNSLNESILQQKNLNKSLLEKLLAGK